MAILRFDPRNLNLDIVVGALESYRPNKTTKEILDSVGKLKSYTDDKIVQIFGKDKNSKQILEQMKKDESKKDKWEEYLHGEYDTKLKEIIKMVEKENKRRQKRRK